MRPVERPLRERAPSGEMDFGVDVVSSLERVRRVVAIVGCQRSGTTLTGQIIGAHPRAVLVDEFDGLYGWFRDWAEAKPLADEATQRMLKQVVGKYRDATGRFRQVGDRVELSPEIDVLVLKAPNLTFDEETVAGLPVPVTVIYPVRDPRAVVASMARLGHIDFLGNQLKLVRERPLMMARYAEDYARMADETASPWIRRAVLWRLKSGRAADFESTGLAVFTSPYENLVAAPRATATELMAACGFTDPERTPAAHTVYVGTGPGDTDRTRPVDAASLDGWRAALSPAQEIDVLAAAQPLAGRLGYA